MRPLLTSVLPTADFACQSRPMRQQETDRHGEVVVGIEKSGRRRDDAVPVGIGIVGEGDLDTRP